MSACNSGGGGGNGTGGTEPTQKPITAQDINKQDRASLQQGGELRQAISEFGDNWNPLNVNGNNADMSAVRNPMSVSFWDFDEKGVPTANKNFLLEAKGNGATPLVVTYKLNPDAKWNDGSPIDVDDFIATWKACNGQNKKFECVSTQGYDAITDIKAGADKFEVIMSYKGAYPDWTSTFGSVLKAESVKDPETFNKGWSKLNMDWFAGPFVLDNFDQTQKVLTEKPNSKWWGDKPLLDKLTFRAISPDATAAAYVNNEIDTFDIGPDPDAYARAKTVADGEIRAAAGPNFRHFTFNQKSGLVQDKAVRQAIVRGLDRAAIGVSDLAGIDWPARPLNNHIFMENQDGYVDSAKATGLDFDPAKAKSDLDAAGWKAGADGTREKDGKKLEVKFSQLSGVPVSENEALQAQKMLAEIGIKLDIVDVPIAKFQDGTLLSQGEFDIVAFSWIGTQYPFSSIKQIYGTDQESNYSKVSIPEVDDLIKKIDVENDPKKRIDLANQADKLLWEDVNTLPLYQRPELIAVKSKLANFGAVGLSTTRIENVGYMK
ncbi:peptide/nickel transport system substrate-binding protein [Microlunatus panaciterrae]|uniref:Peptide/nickel transport system substrate-binding protein n=1 Tax=Microlunatus panaciterrae TaxID=400768 RepID=A0ABS2RHE1_9ACTN|nr:ABC transporter family substrate-binding protein [Microlunatus panaciterrae]MBM7798093.1 peptide/nickel transport system substrate-binding protein [Microlunatus panaciterrae]